MISIYWLSITEKDTLVLPYANKKKKILSKFGKSIFRQRRSSGIFKEKIYMDNEAIDKIGENDLWRTGSAMKENRWKEI